MSTNRFVFCAAAAWTLAGDERGVYGNYPAEQISGLGG